MNLRYTTILISTALAAGVHAQPDLTVGTSVPSAGQAFPVNTANGFLGAGPAGAAVSFQYWNMLIPPTGNQNIEYLAPSATPHSALVPSATLLSTDGGSDTLFWAVTANGLEMVGSSTPLEGVLSFNDASLELKLPCSLGTNWSDPTGDTYMINIVSVTRVGTVTGVADAWGSLALPSGAIYPEVLRVHVRRNITDNSAVANTVRIANIDYYYSETSTHPLVKLVEDSVQISGGAWTVAKKEQYIGNPFNVGVEENGASDIGFTAYPNPTDDLLNISLPATSPSNTRLEVLDPSGRVVLAEALRDANGKMDTSGLPAGVYNLRVLSGDRVLGVRRITVL